MRRAAVLAAAFALTACGGGETGQSRQNAEQARAAELAKIEGWARAFQPDVAVSAANQFGLRPTPYAAAATGGYRSTGGPVTIANSFAKNPNQVAFEAHGETAGQVDTIAFDLALADAQSAETARSRFADLVRDYLFQSRIDAKPIHAAIEKGAAANGNLAGTPWTIAEDKKDGIVHVTVTFTRTGANAPANS